MMKKNNRSEILQAMITPELWEWLKEKAHSEGRSVSSLISVLVEKKRKEEKINAK